MRQSDEHCERGMNKVAMAVQKRDHKSSLEVTGIQKVFPEQMVSELVFEGGVDLMK